MSSGAKERERVKKGGGLREGQRYSQEGGMKRKQQEHKEESISVGIMKSLKEGGGWRKAIWRENRERWKETPD